jgi:two-component system, NtrC family, response regulator AtoC
MEELDYRNFHVLVVDDEADNLDAFRFSFRKAFQISYAESGPQALDLLDRLDAAVIVSDQRMPKMNGIDFLRRAKERRPDVFAVLLTAYADLTVLAEALNSGAVDRYIQKPWDSKELTAIIRQGIRNFATVRENRRLREQVAQYAGYLEREQRDPIDYGVLTGESAAMKLVAQQIEQIAPSSSTVLLEAPLGSEQEVVARAIHVGSAREERPFVRVTCPAFPGDALERELFGYRRGAFPQAFDDRAGRVELADGGTLFLESLGAPLPTLQSRLLRLLEDGIAERVGSTEGQRVDVRLIVSSPEELAAVWSSQEILPQLLARLDVVTIRVPPLSERRDDIPNLALHYLRKYARRNPRAASRLSEAALDVLRRAELPGNARELENVIERAAVLAPGDEIQPEHLAFRPGRYVTAPSQAPTEREAAPSVAPTSDGTQGLPARLDEVERRELLSALERCAGNKAEVARLLGIQRTTLYYRLKRLGIDA